MVKATIICGLLSLLAVQGAVLNNGDVPLHRVARSPHCSECDHYGPPPGPPPPPPPFFHTHQWTGVERGADGSQGVFSGAAAAAESGLQTAGQAFSMASSGVEAGAGANAGAGVGAGIGGGVGAGVGAGVGDGVGSGAASGARSQAGAAGSGYGAGLGTGASNIQSIQSSSDGFEHGNSGSYGGGHEFRSFKESHYSYGDKHFGGQDGSHGNEYSQSGGYQGRGQSGGYQGRGQGGSYQGRGQGGGYQGRSQGGSFQGGSQDYQSQSSGFDAQSSALAQSSSNGNGGRLGGGYNQGYGSGSSGEHRGQYGRLTVDKGSFSSEQQGAQFGSGGVSGNEQQLQSSGHGGGEGQSGSNSYSSSQANLDTQTALHGALDLASQGVQAARQTQTSGCSTCGKSNYALSSAKSNSGNAVAVSVGG